MAKVMVVDDEPEMVFLLRSVLEAGGHEVATSGEEALERLEQVEPELVLLDVMMPGMSGWETCREIKRRRPEVIVAMLTIKGEDEDKLISLEEAGADWHIRKPFENEALLQTVNWLLERHIRRE
ncbi:MAG: response regulator [Euryarchaeota archaeon]|nr:response regulator [Euryarchaeota archaeon]